MERSSTSTRAKPRNPISIANVTTRDGSLNTVIQKPLKAPPKAPMIRHKPKASIIGVPDSTNQPNTQAERPIIEATDRSISAFRIIKTMTKATMIFSIDNSNILIWLSMLRKDSELRALTKMTDTRIRLRNPSQLLNFFKIDINVPSSKSRVRLS